MPAAETQYTFRTAYPSVYQRARATTVSMPVYRDGSLVAPTASGSSFSLLAPDGTELVDGAAITVTGSVATYSLGAASIPATLSLGEGYQEVWVLVLPDGTTRTVDHECALALRPLAPVITDADLEGDYPLASRDRPDGLASWQAFIDQAWRKILGRLASEGHYSYMIKSAWSFREPHLELTHGLRFRALAAARPSQANFLELARQHMDAYEAAWKGTNWTTDDDHDGRVDDPSARRAGGGAVLHVNVPPTRHPSRVRDPRW
jgi:hypothetical protein